MMLNNLMNGQLEGSEGYDFRRRSEATTRDAGLSKKSLTLCSSEQRKKGLQAPTTTQYFCNDQHSHGVVTLSS